MTSLPLVGSSTRVEVGSPTHFGKDELPPSLAKIIDDLMVPGHSVEDANRCSAMVDKYNGVDRALFDKLQEAQGAGFKGESTFLNGLTDKQLDQNTYGGFGEGVTTYRQLKEIRNLLDGLSSRDDYLEQFAERDANGGTHTPTDVSCPQMVELQYVRVLSDRIATNRPGALDDAANYLKSLNTPQDKIVLSVDAVKALQKDNIEFYRARAANQNAADLAAQIAQQLAKDQAAYRKAVDGLTKARDKNDAATAPASSDSAPADKPLDSAASPADKPLSSVEIPVVKPVSSVASPA